MINTPMKIDHHRSLLDPATCQTFTEVIVTDKEKPYVLGTRLRVNHDKIAEIEILWTTTGYWLFNADAYLKYSSTENWGPIPADKRDTRDTLVAAANAYLDAFLEGKKDLVPWGYPCNRTEGGMHTGNGSPTDSCDVGVPSGVNIANRRFIVDETMGTVAVFCTFGAGGPNGGSGAPDTHLFRVENGKLRYVHTLTHLLQANFRGGAPAVRVERVGEARGPQASAARRRTRSHKLRSAIAHQNGDFYLPPLLLSCVNGRAIRALSCWGGKISFRPPALTLTSFSRRRRDLPARGPSLRS